MRLNRTITMALASVAVSGLLDPGALAATSNRQRRPRHDRCRRRHDRDDDDEGRADDRLRPPRALDLCSASTPCSR